MRLTATLRLKPAKPTCYPGSNVIVSNVSNVSNVRTLCTSLYTVPQPRAHTEIPWMLAKAAAPDGEIDHFYGQ